MQKHVLCIIVKLSFLEVNFSVANRKNGLEVYFWGFFSLFLNSADE